MRKVVLTLLVAMVFGWQEMSFAASTVDALIKKLVDKGVLTDQEGAQLKGEIANDEKESNEKTFKSQLPDWVKGIKFSGDFRLRDQIQRKKDTSAANDLVRNRGRFRARLNVEDQINDKVKIVFGLATEGGKDSGVLSNSHSNNWTFGGNGSAVSDGTGTFSKNYISINKAYAVYTPNDKITLMGGKLDNPIWEPASLLWDPDITPEGGAIKLEKKLSDLVTPFSTNTIFVLKDVSPSTSSTGAKTDPYMFMTQDGIKGNLTDKVYYKLAGSWYGVNNPNHLALDNRPGGNNNTNSMSTTAGLTSTYSYNYNIFSGAAEIGMNDPFGELSPIYIPQIGVFGEYVKNPDPSKQNAGWLMGGYMGNSSVSGWGTWRLQSFYKVLERDAWLDALTDDDFYSGATDASGWRSQLDIGLAKNTWLTVSYFRTHVYKLLPEINSSYGNKAPESILQADVNFKF